MSCSRLPTCSFYRGKMVLETGIGTLLKARFCESGNIENCARYMVLSTLGEEYLDDTLFPTMVQKAKK